jgi:hypothetical protein
MSTGHGFRSDFLREITREAVKQGFTLDTTGRHPALICPVCGHSEIITGSGQQRFHESRNKAARLRRHGLVWKGRGGQHAEVQGTDQRPDQDRV